MSTASPIKQRAGTSESIVFFGSTALILVLTAALILYPDSAGALLGRIQAWLSHSFGWYYMLAIGAYLFFRRLGGLLALRHPQARRGA